MANKKTQYVNIFHEYLDKRITLQQAYNMSASWYSSKIRELKSITQADLMRHKAMYTTKPKRGEIYCFGYDPKYKDTLPYYDTFPLVLPLSADDESFLGLNFHYLSPKDRFFLLQAIQKHGRGIHKMNVTWDIVASFANSKKVQHCLKRYLFSHMQTPMRRIRQEDIPTALLLPVEQFVKASKQTVWRKGNV